MVGASPGPGSLWRIILHPVNHGTHHRAEIAEMLSRSGARAPGLELIEYERLSEADPCSAASQVGRAAAAHLLHQPDLKMAACNLT